MRITHLRVRHLQAALAEPMRPRGDVGYSVHAHTGSETQRVATVELSTDAGPAGIAVIGSQGDKTNEVLAARFAPALLGKDPTTVWARVRELHSACLSRGDRHIANHLEFAVWDLWAKERGLPLYRLLGGAPREGVPTYAGGGSLCYNPLPLLVEEARRLKRAGFRSMKVKVGHGAEEDEEIVARLREAVGPEVFLAVDANRAYDLAGAQRLAKGLERYGVAWFEEPFPYAQPEARRNSWVCDRLDDWGIGLYRELRQSTSVPIAGGEGFVDYALTGRLLSAGCLDVFQPDTGVVGLAAMLAMRELASAYHVAFTPHACNNALGLVVSLHLQALAPNDAPQEYETFDNPFIHSLLQDFPRLLADGSAAVPNGPGLGVTLNEGTCERYCIAHHSIDL
jgi:D-galactarolactone cycloisomerase